MAKKKVAVKKAAKKKAPVKKKLKLPAKKKLKLPSATAKNLLREAAKLFVDNPYVIHEFCESEQELVREIMTTVGADVSRDISGDIYASGVHLPPELCNVTDMDFEIVLKHKGKVIDTDRPILVTLSIA